MYLPLYCLTMEYHKDGFSAFWFLCSSFRISNLCESAAFLSFGHKVGKPNGMRGAIIFFLLFSWLSTIIVRLQSFFFFFEQLRLFGFALHFLTIYTPQREHFSYFMASHPAPPYLFCSQHPASFSTFLYNRAASSFLLIPSDLSLISSDQIFLSSLANRSPYPAHIYSITILAETVEPDSAVAHKNSFTFDAQPLPFSLVAHFSVVVTNDLSPYSDPQNWKRHPGWEIHSGNPNQLGALIFSWLLPALFAVAIDTQMIRKWLFQSAFEMRSYLPLSLLECGGVLGTVGRLSVGADNVRFWPWLSGPCEFSSNVHSL